MADVALTILLEELRDVVKWHKELLSGSENEFQQLNDDLKFMKAFPRDADDRTPEEQKIIKETQSLIREVVYDVENALDEWLTAAKGPTSIFSKDNFAAEVFSLREKKVKPVYRKVEAGLAFLGGRAADAEPQTTARPKKDKSIRPGDRVVGFKDAEEELIGYLMEKKEKLDVISIIGMPGLGKTTLAWKIYEEEKIRYEFPIRIWVYGSQRFNSREVFLNILRKFKTDDMSGLSVEELAQSVRENLAKEKFLLVMDDVWSPEDWRVMQNVLPSSNAASKVMITSRLKEVGEHARVRDSSTDPHMLRFFTPDESWELLQLEVYGNEDCPDELTVVGKKIANQCNGVPLTVVVIGGILVNMNVKTRVPRLLKKEWETVSDKVNKFAHNDGENRISEAVGLSYKRLPDHLRECFLYMAVFPEEHVIPAWKLTRLWVAEGFVRRGERSLEELAEQNLNDLVSMNLLMLDQINPMGEIKTCRVHDMIRGFCREIALEQNLFRDIRKNEEGVLEPPVSELKNFHRLCIHSDLTKFLAAKPRGPKIRSFLCFYKETVDLDAKFISTIPDAFQKLRVLESMSIRFQKFPAKVTKLMYLRYVTLHIDALTILPAPLSQIRNLQTLVVKTKSRSIPMKANIWNMYWLRHLKMKSAIVLDREWDGQGGENLQTLSRLAPESFTKKVSEKACNIKELGIQGKLANFFGTMSMENLGRLEKLKLMSDLLSDSEQGLLSLPQPKCFPPNLKRLTLSNTFLKWNHASTLAKIKSLEVLKLKENAFIGTSWNVVADVFESLQLLMIINADIEDWLAFAENFPCLSYLVLKNCERLENIPDDLGNKLETLEIERLCKSAVDSARSIETRKRSEERQNKSKTGVRFKLQVGPGCGSNLIDSSH